MQSTMVHHKERTGHYTGKTMSGKVTRFSKKKGDWAEKRLVPPTKPEHKPLWG